jgi:hypothetical protein
MRFLLGAILALSALATFAASDPTYTALRASRPDGRTIAVTDFAFERDAYRVTLSGTLHLFAPVDGKTLGAVFLGRGAYELTPASETELKLLSVVSEQKDLKTFRDEFDTMLLFDADAIAKAGTPAAAGAVAADAVKASERVTANVPMRLLQALLNGETAMPFIAIVNGRKTPAVLAVDPRGAESLGYAGDLGGEETILLSTDKQRHGLWYSSHRRGEKPRAIEPLATASHYAIDTTFRSNDELAGVTTIDAVSGSAALRVLPINLLSKLRIDEASFAPAADAKEWTPLAVAQDDDGDAAVIFPKVLDPKQPFALRIAYHGREVLENAGDGNFYVRARSSWYPNLGTFTTTASYDLTYRMPQAYQVVSVGEPVSERVEGTTRIAAFKTAQPIRVAGFNYGKFKKVSKTDPESGVTVDVYTNTGTPDIIEQINHALKGAAMGAENSNMFNPGTATIFNGPERLNIDTNGLAQAAIADALNTARIGKMYFGPLKQPRVAITQQSQWAFGQSWPQLIYLPYLAVLSPATRAQFGMMGMASWINQVGPHEFAHQWWGHAVSPASYHDTWLSEGFADFTSALVVQLTGGAGAYNNFWEESRKSIVQRPAGASIDNLEAGPMTLGWRLNTFRNDSASGLVYTKGAYVLQMLRMLMQDRNKQPSDADFIAAMTDFATTYAGRNASTDDFKHMLEKHIVPALDATGDGKLDWFFDQWVYGTEIPRLTSSLKVEDGAEGKVRISGSISQAEVGASFTTLVPLYAEFDKGQVVRIASIPMIGSSTRPINFEVALPKKPRAVKINAMHDVLAK